jgi:hypothetical protein
VSSRSSPLDPVLTAFALAVGRAPGSTPAAAVAPSTSTAIGRAGGCPAGGAPDCDAVSLLPLGVMEPSLGVGGDSCRVSAQAGARVVGALGSQQLALFLARAAPHSVNLVCCQRVP